MLLLSLVIEMGLGIWESASCWQIRTSHVKHRMMLDVPRPPPHMGDCHRVRVGTQTESLLEAGVLYSQNLAITVFECLKELIL